MNLSESDNWQQWMLNALIHPENTEGSSIDSKIQSSAQLSARQCLHIYQKGYILRLTKCLAEQFPALNNALGEALFEQFARLFLQSYPSTSYTLYDLGKRFADFLESERPDKDSEEKESWIDFMIELARYEQLHFSLFDAPGHEGNPWPTPHCSDQQLITQPCMALAQYRFPVAWYYHSCKSNPDVAPPGAETSRVVLVRKDFFVTTYPLTEVHFLFLRHVQQHGSINTAISYISNLTKQPENLVRQSWQTEVKRRWIEAGFFIEK